jgi:hypothetical protein
MSKAQLEAAHNNVVMSNGHNIYVYRNGRPPERWTLTTHHDFPAVFRQSLDEHLLSSVALALRWGLYIHYSLQGVGCILLTSENFHFTFIDLSIRVSAGTKLTSTHRNLGRSNQIWSTLIIGKVKCVAKSFNECDT